MLLSIIYFHVEAKEEKVREAKSRSSHSFLLFYVYGGACEGKTRRMSPLSNPFPFTPSHILQCSSILPFPTLLYPFFSESHPTFKRFYFFSHSLFPHLTPKSYYILPSPSLSLPHSHSFTLILSFITLASFCPQHVLLILLVLFSFPLLIFTVHSSLSPSSPLTTPLLPVLPASHHSPLFSRLYVATSLTMAPGWRGRESQAEREGEGREG